MTDKPEAKEATTMTDGAQDTATALPGSTDEQHGQRASDGAQGDSKERFPRWRQVATRLCHALRYRGAARPDSPKPHGAAGDKQRQAHQPADGLAIKALAVTGLMVALAAILTVSMAYRLAMYSRIGVHPDRDVPPDTPPLVYSPFLHVLDDALYPDSVIVFHGEVAHEAMPVGLLDWAGRVRLSPVTQVEMTGLLFYEGYTPADTVAALRQVGYECAFFPVGSASNIFAMVTCELPPVLVNQSGSDETDETSAGGLTDHSTRYALMVDYPPDAARPAGAEGVTLATEEEVHRYLDNTYLLALIADYDYSALRSIYDNFSEWHQKQASWYFAEKMLALVGRTQSDPWYLFLTQETVADAFINGDDLRGTFIAPRHGLTLTTYSEADTSGSDPEDLTYKFYSYITPDGQRWLMIYAPQARLASGALNVYLESRGDP